MFRATMRLDLNEQQREELNDLRRTATQASRELSRRDREGRTMLAAETKAGILKLLDKEQTEKFEEQLKRADRSRRGRDRGDGDRRRPERGERRPRGDRP